MKLSIVTSKNAEQLYIIKSFRKNGKSTSVIYKKLGTMNNLLPLHNNNRNDVIAWAKQQAHICTQEENEDAGTVLLELSQKNKIPINIPTLFNGGFLFLKDIFHDLKLDSISQSIATKHKFTYDLSQILEMLVYTRIIHPSSNISSYEYSKKMIGRFDFDIQHVYRALSVLAEDMDKIQSILYKNSKKIVKRNTSILYYNCTNYFFEIEEACDDRQYGKSKENRPNPIIQMGLFLDGDALPLAFTITPRNTNEQITLKPTEKKIIKDFELSKFVICTDAGLASAANRKFNMIQGRCFVVTQSIKKLKNHLKKWALDPSGWTFSEDGEKYNISNIDEVEDEELKEKIQKGTFYKERRIKENDGIEKRLIVTFSVKYRDYQRKIRSKQVERAIKMADQNKIKTHKNPNDPARFLKVVNTTESGEIASESYVSINEKTINYEEQYDGYYGVCTNLEDEIETIVKINHRRWEIEESFRIMKSEFKAGPVYLGRKDRIRAHFLVCYLSLLVFRILEKKLEEKYSADKLIETLREMNFKYYQGYGYTPIYTRTEITDDLHEKFGFETDMEIVSEKKFKKILKKVKS